MGAGMRKGGAVQYGKPYLPNLLGLVEFTKVVEVELADEGLEVAALEESGGGRRKEGGGAGK